MKGKTKIALSTLMTCLIIGNVGFAEVVDYKDLGTTVQTGIIVADNETNNLNDANYNYEINKAGKVYGILATANGIANINNEDVKIIVTNNDDNGDTYGVGAAVLSNDSKFTNGGTVNLGTESTKNININVNAKSSATGITATRGVDDKTAEPSFFNVKGKNLIINVHSDVGYAAGIWVQNNTGDPSNPSTVLINAENTYIISTADNKQMSSGEYYNLGLVNYSNGKIIVNGNLTVDAGTAISTRGNAETIINKDGNSTVKINGDINFNYDQPTSGTAVDAVVDITLNDKDSYLNGNIFVNGNPFPPEGKDDVNAMNLVLANGAQWSSDADSFVNNLSVDDGIVNLNGEKQSVTIDNLTGENGTINVASAENKLSITESNNVESLTVAANGAYAEELVKNDITDSLNNIVNQVVDNTVAGGGKTAATDVAIAETGVVGEITAEVGEDGKVIAGSVKELTNSTTAGIGELANVAFMAWRAENDEMHQRMGELRSSTGEAGIWARMKRGESESGDLNITNQYNTYQLGYDEKVGDSNWYLGGAISRTEGKSSFGNGSGENKSTGFTVYGTYVGDNGEYVDLSAKYARLDNEFDVFGRDGIESTGDYRNNGYAFSAEYGKRIEAGNDFWVEPQVQLTYGHLSSANYTTSRGIKAAQDAMNSVIGRVGFAAGKDISAGNVYVKASYLYDFDGDTSVTMNDGVNSRTYEQDLGGGWFEFGIGTNINLSETSHLYFDVERAVGGDIDTPWQWNAGVRFDF